MYNNLQKHVHLKNVAGKGAQQQRNAEMREIASFGGGGTGRFLTAKIIS